MTYPFFSTYQPYYPQPVMQQQTTGIMWVTSELEASNYPVAPNNAVALWDSTKPAIYLKQADASGKPTMKVYMLSERSETPNTAFYSQEGKSTDFALKCDLDALTASIDVLKKEIKALKKKEVENDDE